MAGARPPAPLMRRSARGTPSARGDMTKGPNLAVRAFVVVAGEGFEPSTSGL